MYYTLKLLTWAKKYEYFEYFFWTLEPWVVWLSKDNPSSKTLEEENTLLFPELSLMPTSKSCCKSSPFGHTQTHSHLQKQLSHESEILKFLELPSIDSTKYAYGTNFQQVNAYKWGSECTELFKLET